MWFPRGSDSTPFHRMLVLRDAAWKDGSSNKLESTDILVGSQGGEAMAKATTAPTVPQSTRTHLCWLIFMST